MKKRYEMQYRFIDDEKPTKEIIKHSNWYGAIVQARKIASIFSDDGCFSFRPLDEDGYVIRERVKTI